MTKMLRVLVLTLVCVNPAWAQAATVAVFGSAVTDPNVGAPLATPITYATPLCNQIVQTESPTPITNPIQGIYEDPTNATRECRIDITAQMNALARGNGYHAAVKISPDPYGPFGTAFALAAQTLPHPCDGAAPTAGAVVAGSRTLSWCFGGLDTNGNVTTVTSWTLYTNNVASTLSGVTVGTTANAAGRKLYTATITAAAGTIAYQIAAVNAVAEAAKSATFTATVTLPPAAPATSDIRGIQ